MGEAPDPPLPSLCTPLTLDELQYLGKIRSYPYPGKVCPPLVYGIRLRPKHGQRSSQHRFCHLTCSLKSRRFSENMYVAFSQRSSSPRLIEDKTFNDSDLINNLIDYEDGQEEPDSLRADKNMQESSFPTNWKSIFLK
ncbi:uncharacterized protein TNCV_1016301 [Trichonephila clavipes]|uniref:Uncharacterized protein n=1 Tax=Trichonephila clavipes TaxID=2585209 RepID=A0A8X6VY49_TRICX|nr:uncharacterized protein TNCV_1016301 [Trichonephila clavipes]